MIRDPAQLALRFAHALLRNFSKPRANRMASRLPIRAGMATDITEIIAWQLARDLKMFLFNITARPAVRRDRKFCEQAEDAGASAPRNIAEGFGRFDGKEFAHFLKIAIASEFETRNHILDAFDRGWITEVERDAGVKLTRRAITTATRLRGYLLSPRNKRSAKRSFKEPSQSDTKQSNP